MAYPHTQVDVMVAAAAAMDAVAVAGTWRPGYMPHILRAVALPITVQPTTTPPEVGIYHRPTVGSDTGRTLLRTITIPIAAVPGQVVYADGFNQLVNPGEEIVVEVDVAGATGDAGINLYLEPKWENPGNIADMIDGGD